MQVINDGMQDMPIYLSGSTIQATDSLVTIPNMTVYIDEVPYSLSGISFPIQQDSQHRMLYDVFIIEENNDYSLHLFSGTMDTNLNINYGDYNLIHHFSNTITYPSSGGITHIYEITKGSPSLEGFPGVPQAKIQPVD